MKQFKQFLNEKDESAQDMKQLADDIESLLKRKFPNGNVYARFSNNLTESISVWVGLVGNTRELTSGIAGNDPLATGFTVFRDPKGFIIETRRSALSVNPEEGSYMAMGSVKIPFRKTRGDEKKILKALERWADRTIAVVRDEEANIYNRANYSDKYFKF